MAFSDRMVSDIPPESFLELLDRHAPARDFAKWFQSFSNPPRLSNTDWMDIVVAVARAASSLGWMTPTERRWIKSCTLGFMQRAFTALLPSNRPADREVEPRLKEFVSWLESLPDYFVVRFCWDLFKYDRGVTPAPVRWLEGSGRLTGNISRANVELAVSVEDEGSAMYRRPTERWAVVDWHRDTQPYIELLSHPSYLVRAAASKTLGHLFYGLKRLTAAKAPELVEILETIQRYEMKTPGIAGPFLHGAQWSVEIERWSSFLAGIDMKAWFLATLRQSNREKGVPHIQSLEFYAHELFARDSEAIREFLEMGRRELAVMTATEEPNAIADLRPALDYMASCDDAGVSAAINEYIATRSNHAGLDHVLSPEEKID